jgi:ABC-2 type transport system permease protein
MTPPSLGPTLRLGWLWTRVELRLFFRIPEQVFFTLSLPVLFLIIFASIFDERLEAGPNLHVDFVNYFLPGIIASGIMSSTFANLAISISVQQNEGLLKRLAGTPMPKSAFFVGKLGMAVTITVLQTAIMLALGVVAYDVDLPPNAGRWLVFVAMLLLGAAAGAAMGIAYTRLIPNGRAAAAVVQPPFLILQFISGVFLQYKDVPGWLHAVAVIFPLKWMAEGLRYAFLPDWFGEAEYGASWGAGWQLVVVGAWLAAGFVASLLFFRWDRSVDR